ncbi:MAG: DUF4906 domain-containing protein [Bacteroidales bacterium]|nr:DUF4906 domain-containing protein [Bacteroidales bacterium]
MKRYLLQILLCFCFSTALFSCVNEDMEEPALGKGESTLSVDIAFRPLSDPLTTRTAGDAIKHINDLSIVIYKADKGTLHSCTHYTSSDFSTSEADYPTSLPQGTNGFAEEKTCKTSTISIPNVPYGKYRMYAVVNIGRSLTEAETASEEALRAIQLTWNASDIASNNAMFGFFDTEANKAIVGTSAPEITINAQAVSLHAWVKRAASKVTVAYDGSNLKENIYIYIHSAQIKDIPKTCYLGKENKPTAKNQLNSDGEKISYINSASANGTTVGLTVTKGNPKHGSDHSETANALFFFENMQGYTSADKGKFQDETGDGAVTHPNGSNISDSDYKDGVPYGSYIEVKGYYVNKSAENASQGNITYRFMLGRDVVSDCNAERNNHYKLTLRFKNDANNPDWHIDYTPENPTLSVPTPLYISYGYNEVLNIPVVVRGAAVNENTTIKATIIENPWGYPEHKYYNNSNHDELDDGFLSFKNLGTVSISESDREKWDVSGSSYVSGIKPTKVETDNCQYTVPVYTRPLILANSLTGHNPYVSYQRKAKVRFEVVLNGQTVPQDIEVIQVKRLVNPAGVWRSDNNTSKFNIRLMELPLPDTDANGNMVNESFEAILSDGPWTAHIEEGSDWVQIATTNSGDWGTKDITGGTGSEIRFDYRPKNANTTGNVRCGVIKITYHNNHCVHYVFVSQGLGTVILDGTKWQNRNVLKKDILVANPLLEGSMFKFGNPSDAILSENNHRNGYGFQQDCWGKTFYINTTSTTKTFESITSDLTNGFANGNEVFSNTSVKPSTYAQWKALETLHRRYGVMYGDECTETMTTTNDAYCYYKTGQQRGMQGMFVWDESRNGNHIFFPIGSTSHGHRQVVDNVQRWTDESTKNIPYSVLKYAQRSIEMQPETSVKLPMYYDLWLRKGAIYWYDVKVTNAREFEGTTDKTGYSHDINFHTMLLQTYAENGTSMPDKNGTKSSDAGFIRCVEN